MFCNGRIDLTQKKKKEKNSLSGEHLDIICQ
uniref:Uncharacterized protein n=1 Tax=Arabidopsis thaliana TaxID=3702 RepID=Q56YT5_ARATH|nr:hypothetical protein [Arabidopsis thaliana]